MVDTKMTKSAGEHWVCSVLARRNWGAALTRDGLERTDILAVHDDDSRQFIEVQVKAATGDGPRTSWPLGLKAQLPAKHDREWFVLVALGENDHAAPRSFIVPRNHLSFAAYVVHEAWRTDPSAEPGKRSAGVDRSRVNISEWLGYEDRWDLLEDSAFKAPILLRPEVREFSRLPRVGIPPGHPWRDNLPPW